MIPIQTSQSPELKDLGKNSKHEGYLIGRMHEEKKNFAEDDRDNVR